MLRDGLEWNSLMWITINHLWNACGDKLVPAYVFIGYMLASDVRHFFIPIHGHLP